MSNIAENFAAIHARIEQAARRAARDPSSVRLVAISKTVAVSELIEAIGCGQRLFGENYVQAAKAKIEELSSSAPDRFEFHLTGPLQRNKVKQAVQLFSVIQTVDRLAVAQEISKTVHGRAEPQQVLLQVNISGESAKSGVSPAGAYDLASQIIELPGLRLLGLMSIGAWLSEDVEVGEFVRLRAEEFRAMQELQQSLADRLGVELPELSMGMSEDFELAIEHGATLVRVGTALFGERSLA